MKTNKFLRKLTASLIFGILLLTGGCGLKGDLYIPEKEPASAAPTNDSNEDPETESDTQSE